MINVSPPRRRSEVSMLGVMTVGTETAPDIGSADRTLSELTVLIFSKAELAFGVRFRFCA
jgi:hypothetical protein